MYLWEKIYDESLYESKVFNFYFNDLKIGVFDIETTGLSPDKSQFILGGLVTGTDKGIKVQQFFTESRGDEAAVLEAYMAELSKIDLLISYNGDHFDLPFLNKRLQAHGLSYGHGTGSVLPSHHSFDLYKVLDRHSTLRKLLPNLKQKTVETFLGLWSSRGDEISGKESIDLYYNFLRTGNEEIRETILLHNRDDVLQLSRLLRILEKLDLHKALFHTGFIIPLDEKRVYIQKIEWTGNGLKIAGHHKGLSMDYRHYGADYYSNFSHREKGFHAEIPYRQTKGVSYVDLEAFDMDLSLLEKYPGYESGYLIIKDNTQTYYGEINHLLKLIFATILKDIE